MVLIRLAYIAYLRLVFVRLTDDQVGQYIVLPVFHRHARADSDRTGTNRLGIGIQHAVQFVVARLGAGDVENIEAHQGRSGLGQVFPGIGRIILVRRNRPDSADPRHLERMERSGRLVVLDDGHAGGGLRILEIGKQLASLLDLSGGRFAAVPRLGGDEHGEGRDDDIGEGALVIFHGKKISCFAGGALRPDREDNLDLLGDRAREGGRAEVTVRSSRLLTEPRFGDSLALASATVEVDKESDQ